MDVSSHLKLLDLLQMLCPNLLKMQINAAESSSTELSFTTFWTASPRHIQKRRELVVNAAFEILYRFYREHFDSAILKVDFYQLLTNNSATEEISKFRFENDNQKGVLCAKFEGRSISTGILEHLMQLPNYKGQILHVEIIPSRKSAFKSFKEPFFLNPIIKHRLERCMNVLGTSKWIRNCSNNILVSQTVNFILIKLLPLMP